MAARFLRDAVILGKWPDKFPSMAAIGRFGALQAVDGGSRMRSASLARDVLLQLRLPSLGPRKVAACSPESSEFLQWLLAEVPVPGLLG
ncbi:hypothetical protein [Mangrovicoccus sp. HB161399]|uniref:hypothetical protein n=1 Tax=Mangrovicoccus sp. HB161399 TaxID=2720392 RepID=UPI0015563AF8|nr:hypothetical protein [Mangrovicoccus sp. HB161399]